MKLITLLFIFTLSSTLNSQTEIFNENFETGIPSTWTIVNQDLLTPNSAVAEYNQAWISSLNSDDLSDSVASSTSFFTSPGRANRWLISPQITLGTFGNYLSWESKSFDPSFPESFRVLISTTGTAPSDFNDTLDFFTFENSVWTTHELHLDALGYSNQPIYIAFVLYTNDGFKFLLDDVKIRKEDPVSLHEVANKYLTIAPNPASNYISLSCDEEIMSISIATLENKELIKLAQVEGFIDVSSLIPGVYMIEVTTKNGLKSKSKLMKM